MYIKKFIIIFLWLLVLILPVRVLIDGVKAYINGTYHGFNADEKIYGLQAFVDAIVGDIAFGFIFFIIWIFIFVCAIYFTKKNI